MTTTPPLSPTNRQTLESALDYCFRDPDHLTGALRHSSWVNEQGESDVASNERMEFLGDAVLNLVVSELLMQHYPDLDEGDLSRNRAHLVNESQLAAIARDLDLGPHLLLGKGEDRTHGRQKNSILADAVEALIAAVYLDGGFKAAFTMVQRQFAHRLEGVVSNRFEADYKSRLQEQAQSRYHEVPCYEVIGSNGPDHNKTFTVRMSVANISAEGDGRSKKMAEQQAARAGLELLQRQS